MLSALKVRNSAVVILLVALIFSALPFVSSTARAEVGSKSASSDSQLLSCMGNKDATLNVLYLVDVSASWKYTDKENRRGSMIAQTMGMFSQLGEDITKPVQYSFAAFGTAQDTGVKQSWMTLNKGNVSQESARVKGWAQASSSLGTNWEAGLDQAKELIQKAKRQSKNPCFVMVWLTDGSLDLSDGKPRWVEEDFKSMVNIKKKIDYFRLPSHNVTVIGLLIDSNSKVALENRPYAGGPDAFKWIITGSGTGPVKLPHGHTFDNPLALGQIAGHFISEPSINDMKWEFVDLIAGLTGLRRASTADSNPTIPMSPYVGKIQIYIKNPKPGQDLKISDSNEIDVCSRGICQKSNAGSSSTFWTVKIPRSGIGSISEPQEWTVGLPPGSVYRTFVGLTASLIIKPSKDLKLSGLGEGTSVSGTVSIVDKISRKIIEPSDFDSINFCLNLPESLHNCQAAAELPISNYVAASSDHEFSATAELVLPGIDEPFVLDYSTSINVQPSKRFAHLDCEDVKNVDGDKYCVLNPMSNSFKASNNEIFATIINGKGSVKITGFTANDLPDRAEKYSIVSPMNAIRVAAGQKASIPFSFLTTDHENLGSEDITGTISYESVSIKDGKMVKSRLSLPVIYSIGNDTDWVIFAILYLILLVLGLGIPYLFLLIQAKRKAVFFTGEDAEFRFLTVPVKVASNGTLMSLSVADDDSSAKDFPEGDKSSYVPFIAPDWRKLSRPVEIPKSSKRLTIGPAELAVSQIKFDAFAPVSVSLAVPNSLVFSNQGSKAFELKQNVTTGDLNVNALVFFYGSDDLLMPIETSSFKKDDGSFGLNSDSSLVLERAKNARDLEGSLVFVLLGIQNSAVSISKIAKNLAEHKFDTVIKQLDDFREAALTEANEHQKDSGGGEPGTDWDDNPGNPGPTGGSDFDDFN